MTLNPLERNMARHALGLPNGPMRSFRNRYFVMPGSGATYDAWQAMTARGFAMKGQPQGVNDFFFLTRAGAEAALEPGERLCPEDFPPVVAPVANPAQPEAAPPHPIHESMQEMEEGNYFRPHPMHEAVRFTDTGSRIVFPGVTAHGCASPILSGQPVPAMPSPAELRSERLAGREEMRAAILRDMKLGLVSGRAMELAANAAVAEEGEGA